MKTVQTKKSDELRMSSKDFDRIMGQALRVRPEAQKKSKRSIAKSPKKKSAK